MTCFVRPPLQQPAVPAVKEVKCSAPLSVIKALYHSEKNSLVKKAPTLSHKTLHPSNLERQQVKLVTNIFNEYTVTALLTYDDPKAKETANFVRLITAWWKVMNVKHPEKGRKKKTS